jgi:NAD(P)-dependent dehydrogenase (short-subunit alcohol dehydrogenase family)
MKIAVIGASGNAGSRITAELVRRGHSVTAIVRHPEKVSAQAGVTPVKGDVMDEAGLARLVTGHDAVISSVRFLGSDPAKLIGAAKEAKVGRYLVVGGAGSLEVAPGVLQGGGRSWRRIPRPAPRREGTQMDLPVALGAVRGRGAHRKVPTRDRPAFDRR